MGRTTKSGKNFQYSKSFKSIKELEYSMIKTERSIRWTKSEKRDKCKICKRMDKENNHLWVLKSGDDS